MDSRGADSRGNGEYRFDGIDRKTDLEEGDAGAGGETEVVAEVEEAGCGGGGRGEKERICMIKYYILHICMRSNLV